MICGAYTNRGGATVLKVGDKFCERKFFDPHFLASGGGAKYGVDISVKA